MAQEAMDLCLRMLKEETKVGLAATVSENSVLIISHITFRDCRVHIFSDNPSRNNCISFGLAMREVSHFLFSGWGYFCSSLSAAPRDACARVHSPHYISEKRETAHSLGAPEPS